jgi:NTP pyrophosphatase (non-canonical NTP hydrolase)
VRGAVSGRVGPGRGGSRVFFVRRKSCCLRACHPARALSVGKGNRAMTKHFNQLTEAEQERLSILIEECGEVVQAGCKILRHGYESTNKGQMAETNRQQLAREIGDLLHAMNRMAIAADFDYQGACDRAESRAEHVHPYLHHQTATPEQDEARGPDGTRASNS